MHPLDPKEVEISVRRWVEQNGGYDPQRISVEYAAEACSSEDSRLTVDLGEIAISIDLETMRTFPELLPSLLRRHMSANRVA